MKTILLADKNTCTACGACAMTCPKGCIRMEHDEMDCLYPVIDREACVSCGKCMNVCPAMEEQKRLNTPFVAYAAWNTDPVVRRNAASGGIASAIYSYCLKHGIKTYGVYYEPGGTATYIPVTNEEDMEKCRNSKYVFSDITPVFEDIKQNLDAGNPVIIPGLPCQLAAVRSAMGENRENLILVDIVCHGICPDAYLNQHVTGLQLRKNKTAEQVTFRDPEFETEKYMFTLRNQGRIFYKKKVAASDTYHLGYHKSLNYRENCYHCAYARPERVGDMTISDFSGLGKLMPFTQERRSVSCVLINSDCGQAFWNRLQEQGLVEAEERPLGEALEYEKQLKAPSVPHTGRRVFENEYRRSGHYDSAAKRALKKDICRNNIRNTLHVDFWMGVAAKVLPAELKKRLKRIGKKNV